MIGTQRIVVAVVLSMSILCFGCGRPEAELGSPENVPQADAPERADRSPASDETEQDDGAMAMAIAEIESEPLVVGEPQPLPQADHRVWLPTTAGPLVLDVDCRIGDRSLRTARSKWLESVLSEASGSGVVPTWAQLSHWVAVHPEIIGDAISATGMTEDQLLRRYDLNRNKLSEPEEAAKYLYQSSGHWSEFRVHGTAAHRHVNRDRSAVWSAIDADHNGVLDGNERQAIGDRIRARFDRNTDGIVGIEEVRGTYEVGDRSAWDRRLSHRRGDVAMDLDGYIDWSSLAFALDRDETTKLFGVERNFQRMLDRDSNGLIDGGEASQLRKLPADLRIELKFSDGFDAIDEQRSVPVLSVIAYKPEWEALISMNPDEDSLTVVGRSLRLTIEVLPSPPATTAAIWNTQVRGRAAEVPDAWFAELDLNQDRRLSPREMQSPRALMEETEAANGHISPETLRDAVLVQFGRGDPKQDEYRFSAADVALTHDQQARPHWALAMDANGDGDIAEAEFLGTADQFQQFDRNSDHFIDSSEVDVSGITDR